MASLRTVAASFGIASVTLTTQQLEDYVKSLVAYVLVMFVAISRNASAEELYLRCELRNWCCNPITFRVDLDHSVATVGDARHRATITAHQIAVPFENYGPNAGHYINRMTGDFEFRTATNVWTGTCTKVDQRKF